MAAGVKGWPTPPFPSQDPPAFDWRADLAHRWREAFVRNAAVLDKSAVLFEHHAVRLETRGHEAAAAEERRLAVRARDAAARADPPAGGSPPERRPRTVARAEKSVGE